MKLGKLAKTLGVEVFGDTETTIYKAMPLEFADQGEIALVRDKKVAESMHSSKASALIVPPDVEPDRPSLIAVDPSLALAKTLEVLDPENKPPVGIDKSAVIGSNVIIGEDVHIGAHVSVGDDTIIGDHASIRAGVRLGLGCFVGSYSVIFENVVVYEGCSIGDRCRIHANSVIGADGFGYHRLPSGFSYKIPQRGVVRLEDDVEIGAASTIDRATMGETIIRRGVKIDNQVQIGHNCDIGEDTIIAGCSGISGSVKVGAQVTMGGQVGVADHVNIIGGAIIAAKTGVHKNIKEKGIWGGPLVMKNMEYKRLLLSSKRIDKLLEKIKWLEKRLG